MDPAILGDLHALLVEQRRKAYVAPDAVRDVLQHAPPPRLAACVEAASASLSAPAPDDARRLASLAWSYAKLGVPREHLRPIVTAFAAAPPEEEAPRAAATLLWAAGRAGFVPANRELGRILGACQPGLPRLDPAHLVNILWACATLRKLPSRAFLDAWTAAALPAVPRFGPQQVSNTLWAFAALRGRPADALVRAVVARAAEVRLDDRERLNLSWACARLGVKP
jgi:hypothetical protein